MQGTKVVGSNLEDFSKHIRDKLKLWAEVIKSAGNTPDLKCGRSRVLQLSMTSGRRGLVWAERRANQRGALCRGRLSAQLGIRSALTDPHYWPNRRTMWVRIHTMVIAIDVNMTLNVLLS